jgi:hypothetical protein
VTLTATPSGTNLFYGWSGSTPSTNNPLLITIASNTMVRAHFQFLPLDIVWTNTLGGRLAFPPPTGLPIRCRVRSDNAIIPITATVTVNSPAECLSLTLGSVSGTPDAHRGAETLMVHDNSTVDVGKHERLGAHDS